MYPPKPAEHLHDKFCFGNAIKVSLENLVDSLSDLDFTRAAQDGTLVREARAYLDSGTTVCICFD